MQEFCTFCKIISGDLPSDKVYEDDTIIAILDVRPVNLGHTLVMPKAHYETIYGLPDRILKDLALGLRRVGLAVTGATVASGTNVILNSGAAAGQIIFHVHFHIIPRFEGDRLRNWPGKLYSEGELKEMAEKISVLF